jgi:hypothetical protein
MAYEPEDIAAFISDEVLKGGVNVANIDFKIGTVTVWDIDPYSQQRLIRLQVYDWQLPFDGAGYSQNAQYRPVFDKIDMGGHSSLAMIKYTTRGHNRQVIFNGNPQQLQLFEISHPRGIAAMWEVRITGVWRMNLQDEGLIPLKRLRTIRPRQALQSWSTAAREDDDESIQSQDPDEVEISQRLRRSVIQE